MSSDRRLSVRALALAVFLAGAGFAAPPADPPPTDAAKASPRVETPPVGDFVEAIEVNIVNVEVYVTDKQGRRIKGLGRDDFEIYEDRKPVKVTNFYAEESGRPRGLEEVGVAALPVPPPLPGAAEMETPEDQRLHLVIYIDNFNLRPFDRNRVMRSLHDFLRNKLHRGDRAMLVTYDRELHVRRDFTTDPATISSALFELETISAQGVQHDSDRREILRDIQDVEQKSATDVLIRARGYAESLSNDLQFSIGALKETIETLAGLQGRKAVVYVSNGLSQVVGEDIFYAIHEKFPTAGALTESRDFDLSSRFRELVATANANRVTFYTIDAAGLRAPSSVSAENQNPGGSAFVDNVYVSNLQAPLQMLANETGGKAILNTNNVEPALAQVAEDFDTFYSLGYSPIHAGDGRYHKVDVKLKVKARGVTVRHRDGYRDKSVEGRMGDGLTATLNFGLQSNPLDVKLEVGSGRRRDDGFYLVPVTVRVPIGKLVLLPHGEKQQASRVRLFVSAMDEKGGTSDVQQVPLTITVPNEEVTEAIGKSYAYSMSLLMRPGPQRLAIGVRDDYAAALSFVLASFQVGGS